MNWTDQDVDNLLASVDEALAKADVLAKSAPLKKDDENGKGKDADDKPAQDAAPADAAPADAGAAPADAAPAADAGAAPAPEAPAADASAAPAAEGDEQLQQEGAEDAPLTDEELSQIYSSMPPEELERHYSILRQALQASYAQDEGQAEAAPAAPAAEPAAEPAAAPAEMGKSEKDTEIAELKKQVGELVQANEQIVKAFEVLTKPARKSITDIQVMQKSEFDAPPANGSEAQPMTTQQAKDALRKIPMTKLEKSERDMVNKFFISGEGQKEIEKLIHSKGGK